MWVLAKKKFREKTIEGEYRKKQLKKGLTGGSTGRVSEKKDFLIKPTLFNTVLCADSEYHTYFALRLCFSSRSPKIPAHFLTFYR
jgi:hypothetical protein